MSAVQPRLMDLPPAPAPAPRPAESASKRGRINDWGMQIPNAKKHLSERGGASGFSGGRERRVEPGVAGQDSLRLRSLWPEPDWAELARRGRLTPEVAARLMMIYRSFAKTSGEVECGIDESRWRGPYARAVELARQLMRSIKTLDEAKSFTVLFARMAAGISPKEIAQQPISANLVYWALSKQHKTKNKIGLLVPGYISDCDSMLAQAMPACGWPGEDWSLRARIVPLAFTRQGEQGWVVARLLSARMSWVDPKRTMHSSMAEAVQAACAAAVNELDTASRLNAHLRRAEGSARNGPPRREAPEKEVDVAELGQTFGLRGVQFGAALSGTEQRVWITQVYDALADLAAVLGMPTKWLGLGGRVVEHRLALAFGARGRGHARAHYEPRLRVINATRAKGAGCIAHEWGHALDHRLATAAGLQETSLFEGRKWLPMPDGSEELERARALESLAAAILGRVGRPSQFVSRSVNLAARRGQPEYWGSERELFARAFEAWVEDRLASAGVHSPWLVSGTVLEDLSLGEVWPYPLGAERRQINQCFDAWVHTLRLKTGAVPAPPPRRHTPGGMH